MTETVDIILPLEESETESARRDAAAKKLGISPKRIVDTKLRKHSIDARQRKIKVQLRLDVAIDQPFEPEPAPHWSAPALPAGAKSVIIIGCGPAGLFAALRCLENGLKPIVLERGKDASARRFDLAPILREGRVIEESNYCFGEGGAGTFSDGKLYTRATKRGPVARVYEILVAHGAPERILTDAHPHIGSNLLPNVVKSIRASIIAAGGEVRFETKVTDFLLTGNRIRGVVTAKGDEITADSVILATGHSARDIYRLLAAKGILLEAKPFAVGFRIEHPQPFIDGVQYHLPKNSARPDLLPAARYRLATKIRDRGVHSFCMCPGGWIVPASTENDEVVVNGMSLSRRDSPFANSGMVSTVEPEDLQPLQKEHGILAGLAFQKELERASKIAGGGGQVAPGQRVTDFIAGKISADLPETSYFPGAVSSPLHEILPNWITSRMREGLSLFGRQMHGYVSSQALLLGFETRTSSPVRIPRRDDTLEHPEIAGLFPCGEGAGYAGGIVSAAMDGLRIADACNS
ncbi:FAD-binding protein [Luteolibacter pohnpeiensis]|uniref:FAD-binding protein n=1 Tax=Luteolibacter pohnpeiensis TaxID=454153 RepID=A0A934SCV0_9BACT|nr:FAD-dependent oxidoreductase [Luteolibacter pohnpeiensis]MBK1883797.1 FAD-binding protein [Luteolibacter pohnpeiensis]